MSGAADPLAGVRSIHTRSLDVEVRAAGDGARLWEVRGELVDLRKAAFVPIAAELQTAGLLHHMRVRGRCDPRSQVLLEMAAEQPVVAFEPSQLSEGECCRDPLANLAALAGAELTPEWDRRLREAIGGPRGCSHVLALARLVGATSAWLAMAPRAGDAVGWRAGERIFHRSLCFDGAERGEDELVIDLQLTDLHCAPAPEVARPLARLAGQSEVRGRARLGRSDLVLRALRLARRGRGVEGRATDGWQELGAALTGLTGTGVGRGMRRRVLESLPGEAPGAPAAAALLDLPPAALQCVASDCDHWPVTAADDPSAVVSVGPRDSCWMWRADGALTRARERERRRGRGADP